MQNSNNTLKRNKASLISIILAIFLLVITLGAFGTSSYFSYKKCTIGKGYDISYNVRYEFDPYSNSEDPSLGLKDPKSVEEKEVRENMNKNASAFSSMLAESGISNSNVYSEVYTDNDGKVHAYLNTTIPNKKVSSTLPGLSDDEKDSQDIAISKEYYRGMDSARYTFIYCDGYTVPASGASDKDFQKAKLYMWDLHDITDQDQKIQVNKTDSNKINIQLKGGLSFGKKDGDRYEENSIKQTFYDAINKKEKSNDEEKKDEVYPFIYVIRDYRGMVNYLQYIVRLYWYYNYSPERESLETKHPEIYKAYYQLSSEEKNYAQFVLKEDSILADRLDAKFLKYDFDNDAGFQKKPLSKLDSSLKFGTSSSFSTPFSGENNILNSAILTTIQALSSDNHIAPGSSSQPNSSYSFLKKYILSIINRDNYKDILTDKNPNNTDVDSDGQWLVMPNECSSYYTTSQIINQMTKEKFAYPLMDNVYSSLNASVDGNINNVDTNGLTSFINVSKVNNEISGSVIIGDGVVTTIITIVIFLLLVGLLVSYLYRIPGLISFVYLFAPIPLTLLILFMSGYSFTLPIAIAMLITTVVGAISIISIMSRVKKYHLSHRTLDQSLSEGFKKSLLPILDLHAVLFILGACCLFFSIADLLAIGVSLILGSIFSFIFTYGFNYLTNYLLFTNAIGMYKSNWFSKYKISLESDTIPAKFINPEESKVQNLLSRAFDKDGVISQIHVKTNWILNWKTFTIVVASCIGIILLGSIIAFTAGVPAFNFYGGTRLMIKNDNGISLNEILDKLNAINGSWHNISFNDHFFYLESSQIFEYSKIASALNGLTFFVQNIDPQSTFNFTANILYVVLAFSGFMIIYGLIRYNWISCLPILMVGLITPLTLIAIIITSQIYFDINVNYVILIISALTQILAFTWLSSLSSHWFKKNYIQSVELKNAFAYVISSLTDNLIYYIAIMVALVISMALLFPTSLWFISIFILFGTIIAFAISYMTFPYLLMICTNLKNHYKIRLHSIQNGIEKRNFDKVDEELINTININTSNSKSC